MSPPAKQSRASSTLCDETLTAAGVTSEQENPVLRAEYVVFSGGGTRGFCFAGAMQALEDYVHQFHQGHFFARIRGFAGASIGALFAMLYAAGYTSRTLREEILARDLGQVFSGANPITFFQKWGMDDGTKLQEWIEDLLERRYGVWARRITFADFERLSGKQLVIPVTIFPDHSDAYVVDVSATTHPTHIVSETVRISMSLPALIAPVRVVDDAGAHRQTDRRLGVHHGHNSTSVWSDGALIDSLPFRVWGGKRTLGLLLVPNTATPMRTPLDYLQRALLLGSKRATEYFLQSLTVHERACILEIDAPASTLELSLTRQEKLRMFDTAYISAQQYLSKFSVGLMQRSMFTIATWACQAATPAQQSAQTPAQPSAQTPDMEKSNDGCTDDDSTDAADRDGALLP